LESGGRGRETGPNGCTGLRENPPGNGSKGVTVDEGKRHALWKMRKDLVRPDGLNAEIDWKVGALISLRRK